jgi:hypothetical protein
MAPGLLVNHRVAPHVCTRIFGFCKFGVRCKFSSVPPGGCLHHARGTCTFGEGCSFLHQDDFLGLPSQFPRRNDEPLANSVQVKFHNRGLQTDEIRQKSVSVGTQAVDQGSDFGQTCRLVLRTKSVGCQATPPVSFASSCPSSLPWSAKKTGWTQTRGHGHKKTATITPVAVHAATENPWSVLHTHAGTGTADLEGDLPGSQVIELGHPPAPFRHVLRRFRRSRQFRRLLGLLAQPDERGAAEGAEEDEVEEDEEEPPTVTADVVAAGEEEDIGPADAELAGCPICTTGNSPRVIPPASREAAGLPAQDHQEEEEEDEEEEASADADEADADFAAAADATAAALAAVHPVEDHQEVEDAVSAAAALATAAAVAAVFDKLLQLVPIYEAQYGEWPDRPNLAIGSVFSAVLSQWPKGREGSSSPRRHLKVLGKGLG